MVIAVFFSIYNYKIAPLKLYYQHHKICSLKNDKKNTDKLKQIERNMASMGPQLFLAELRQSFLGFLEPCLGPRLKDDSDNDKSTSILTCIPASKPLAQQTRANCQLLLILWKSV